MPDPVKDSPTKAIRFDMNARRQRGSVLLLAVGLLTILAMLGATLLITSWLDAKQSKALAAKAPADPIAEGIVAKLKATLKADLHIGDAGGMDAPYAGGGGWAKFIDYPSGDADAHLTDHAALPGHPSALLGSGGVRVDTDGDGTDDAYLVDTGVTNGEGQKYYAAVRVTDLSGLLNVNVHTDGAPIAGTVTYPTKTDLANLKITIDTHDYTLNYATLSTERCGSANPPWDGFFLGGTKNFFNPQNAAYRPYSIGEEMYLRWLGSGQLTQAGRLPAANISTALCPYLTTFNCTRQLVRHPRVSVEPSDPNYYYTRMLGQMQIDPNDFVDTDPNGVETRNAFCWRVYQFLRNAQIGLDETTRKEMACHFTANLWAYLDGYREKELKETNHWRFVGPWLDDPAAPHPNEYQPFAVYGLSQDLVITEAYAKNIPDSGAGAGNPVDDWVYGCAIELMNPTDHSISLSDYKLIVMTSTPPASHIYDLAPGKSIPPNGGKLVIYNFQEGHMNEVTRTELFGTSPINWYQNNHLDFTQYDYVRIKIARDVNGYLVPIDEVWKADLNYNVLDPTLDGPEEKDIRRDDDLVRARYNAAEYKLESGNGNRLGKDNNLLADDPDLKIKALFSVPIPANPNGAGIADLGELMQIYLTGPYDEGASTRRDPYQELESFPRRLAKLRKDGILPDTPARGRFDLHPDDVSYLHYTPGIYPDVPAAALLGELFTLVPPDDTRADEDPDMHSRVYGKININTATAEVLKQLPWPDWVSDQQKDDLVKYILAYRDRQNLDLVLPDGPRYAPGRAHKSGAGINELRNQSGSDINGFLTPGEIAIPLADYANKLAGWLDYNDTPQSDPAILDIVQDRDYIRQRDSLYTAISNLITVNSDTYAANIRVQIGDDPAEKDNVWYYITVIDRSNCRKPEDTPAVLLFSEVK